MPKFKSDRFKKSRGGYSRWLLVFCENCKEPLLVYQKDGPGILKRLYIDRILNARPVGKEFACKKCKTVLGVRMIYKKENRPAYRLFAGAVGRKVLRADELNKMFVEVS